MNIIILINGSNVDNKIKKEEKSMKENPIVQMNHEFKIDANIYNINSTKFIKFIKLNEKVTWITYSDQSRIIFMKDMTCTSGIVIHNHCTLTKENASFVEYFNPKVKEFIIIDPAKILYINTPIGNSNKKKEYGTMDNPLDNILLFRSICQILTEVYKKYDIKTLYPHIVPEPTDKYIINIPNIGSDIEEKDNKYINFAKIYSEILPNINSKFQEINKCNFEKIKYCNHHFTEATEDFKIFDSLEFEVYCNLLNQYLIHTYEYVLSYYFKVQIFALRQFDISSNIIFHFIITDLLKNTQNIFPFTEFLKFSFTEKFYNKEYSILEMNNLFIDANLFLNILVLPYDEEQIENNHIILHILLKKILQDMEKTLEYYKNKINKKNKIFVDSCKFYILILLIKVISKYKIDHLNIIIKEKGDYIIKFINNYIDNFAKNGNKNIKIHENEFLNRDALLNIKYEFKKAFEQKYKENLKDLKRIYDTDYQKQKQEMLYTEELKKIQDLNSVSKFTYTLLKEQLDDQFLPHLLNFDDKGKKENKPNELFEKFIKNSIKG